MSFPIFLNKKDIKIDYGMIHLSEALKMNKSLKEIPFFSNIFIIFVKNLKFLIYFKN